MGRRAVSMAGLAVAAALVAAGCGDDRVDQAGATTLFRLQPGQCFNSPAAAAGRTVELKDVTAVDCAEGHDGEVFAVVTHPAAKDVAYPGDDSVADFAASECLLQFPTYTGTPYDDSDLEVATIRPDEDSWADKDDREVACVLYQKGTTLTGSRRKA